MAIPAHNDRQDVFILQLEGHKRWVMYKPVEPLPTYEQERGKVRVTRGARQGALRHYVNVSFEMPLRSIHNLLRACRIIMGPWQWMS